MLECVVAWPVKQVTSDISAKSSLVSDHTRVCHHQL